MEVKWIKCTEDKWCPLNNVNLSHAHFEGMEGVYIIWHGGTNPSTVRVGQGDIADRLAEHQEDGEIQDYAHLNLYVTWADVPAHQHNGVEAYLADQLDPLVGQRYPDVMRIPVNLPW